MIGEGSEMWGTLRLPNLEVGTVFRKLFERWLAQGVGGERQRQQMIQALLTGDLARFQEHLQRLLVESSSFHDVGGKRAKMPPEHVYQVFILGLLVSMPRHRVTANREGGHGRYDRDGDAQGGRAARGGAGAEGQAQGGLRWSGSWQRRRSSSWSRTTPPSCGRRGRRRSSRWPWRSMASGCWWAVRTSRRRRREVSRRRHVVAMALARAALHPELVAAYREILDPDGAESSCGPGPCTRRRRARSPSPR